MNDRRKRGRNERCPVCGEKNKNCTCSPRKSIRLYVVGVVAMAIVAMTLLSRSRNPEAPTPAAKPAHTEASMAPLRTVLNKYLEQHTAQDAWWLVANNNADMAAENQQMERRRQEIIDVLAKYRDVSPLTKQISTAFTRFAMSMTIGNATVMHGSEKKIEEFKNSDMEIAFIPKQEEGRHPAALYYDATQRKLAMYAVNWPKRLFAGLIYHELGHGLAHKQGKASALALDGSDLWIEEELEMHELEDVVIDKASDGAYFTALDRILDQQPSATWRDAVLNLTLADMQRLDTVLECRNAGPIPANTLGAQYMFAVGSRFIARSQESDAQKATEKIQLYRFLREVASH